MLEHKPTQCEKIIDYIKTFGSITALDAFLDLGVTQLGARIFELKQDGYIFITENRKAVNRSGEIVHFKAYKLNAQNIYSKSDL